MATGTAAPASLNPVRFILHAVLLDIDLEDIQRRSHGVLDGRRYCRVRTELFFCLLTTCEPATAVGHE
jgi:hypothetical protein